jgi:hypothetical protein
MKINTSVPVSRLLCEWYIGTDTNLYILAESPYKKNAFETEYALTWIAEWDFIDD